jgi:hypothetical protein
VVVVLLPVEEVPLVGEVEPTGGGDPAGGSVTTVGPVGTTTGGAASGLAAGIRVATAIPALVSSASTTGTTVRSGTPPTWVSQNPFDRGSPSLDPIRVRPVLVLDRIAHTDGFTQVAAVWFNRSGRCRPVRAQPTAATAHTSDD